jgi:anthranilate synthase component 1
MSFVLKIDNPGLSASEVSVRLCGDGPGFVLESVRAEGEMPLPGYVSGPNCRIVRIDAAENPFQVLRELLAKESVVPGLTGFAGGAIGYIAYEAMAYIEPTLADSLGADPTGSPLAAMLLADEFVVVDPSGHDLTIVVQANGRPDHPEPRAIELANLIETARPDRERHSIEPGDVHQIVSRTQYEELVQRAREAIIDGELIQAVLSQRIETYTGAKAIDIYREMAGLNPSPYMFMLNFGDFQMVGASPERMVKVQDGVASSHPIAGTRPRGDTLDADAILHRELVTCEKESAEHVMLLDLARNDLGRVCEPGTLRVESFMHVERYSHVQHLVSRIAGRLTESNDAISALEAGFPIGTLTGAPKIRAMRLISELEREGRGPYTGAVGWFSSNGDLDTGTTIRALVLKDGIAHVQGGGGIVFDSDPSREYEESWHKMHAPLLAISNAESMSQAPIEAVQPVSII